jgi:glycosyltransferase involved in cell wall biosynthesis
MYVSLYTLINFVVAFIGLLVCIYFLYKLQYAFTHFKMKSNLSAPAMLTDLPSVSVCIPARNETHAMTQCLEHVIASTYPKLEVIVLDDSSKDNTSILIKSFAHEGVRFVEGSPLPDHWLGKNHALQGLLDEASGSYILFMDVDTIIEPTTIEELVSYMSQEEATMISVLPRRNEGLRASVIFSTLRYFWQLILHTKKNPAVASGAWMIHRHILRDTLGGFASHAMSIQPEAEFAAELMQEDKYRFMLSTQDLGVNYEKKWRSQVDTSLRLLFPMLSSNIILAIGAILLLIVILQPLVALATSIFIGWSVTSRIAVIEYTLFLIMYAKYLHKVWRGNWWIGMFLWPFIVLQELILLIISICKYLSHSVMWKGRLVVRASNNVQD